MSKDQRTSHWGGERHSKACSFQEISRVTADLAIRRWKVCHKQAMLGSRVSVFCYLTAFAKNTATHLETYTWPNCLDKTRPETKRSWAIPMLSLPPSPHLSLYHCIFSFFYRTELHNISDLSQWMSYRVVTNSLVFERFPCSTEINHLFPFFRVRLLKTTFSRGILNLLDS